MVKVTKKDYYMDGYLKKNLDIANKAIRKDWDMVILVDGMEGSGKSVMAQQAAYYCDPSFNLKNIVFTPSEFKKEIMTAKKYTSIVYDEAYTGLSSRATMSMINRALVSMLAEIRQRNLFVFVVMPTFFDLDKYVAIWRSRALINLYTDGFNRGYFKFYSSSRKKELYVNGKKFYNYFKPEPNFRGRFTDFYTVDKEKYKRKKRDSLMDREKKAEEALLRREIEDAMFIRIMALPQAVKDKVQNNILAKVLGISESYYYIKLKKWEENRLLESM